MEGHRFRCPEGEPLATQKGALMLYTPSTLPKSVEEKLPQDDEQSEASSRASPPEPERCRLMTRPWTRSSCWPSPCR